MGADEMAITAFLDPDDEVKSPLRVGAASTAVFCPHTLEVQPHVFTCLICEKYS